MSYLHTTPARRGGKTLAASTPQSQPIQGSTQVRNHAGGFSWEAGDWDKLDRFLILGSEAGTYYVGQQKLTRQHAVTATKLIGEDGHRVVRRVVEISQGGRAPKNDPALYVLAMASVLGDANVRRHAFNALPAVARTFTHLADFLSFRQEVEKEDGQRGGWGRGLKRAVGNWYLGKSADNLAYQVVKYRNRNGWTHRDVLRKAHPRPPRMGNESEYRETLAKANVIAYAAGKLEGAEHHYETPLIQGFTMAQRSPSPLVTASLIRQYGLPREAVLTEHLNDPVVWEALLVAGEHGMPITATIRNLATMTKIGLLTPFSSATRLVVEALTSEDKLRFGRVHPVQILAALKTYGSGRGMKGSGVWTPVPQIMDALDHAFYLSFRVVQPTGKRLLLGLDVSGSMASTRVSGIDNLMAREACAAMALVTAATEPAHAVVAFDASSGYIRATYGPGAMSAGVGDGSGLYPLSISPRQRLDDVVGVLGRTGGGGTDCVLPIQYAIDNNLPVDAFVIYTDSETWQGREHPAQAIRRYRQHSGINAKMVVVALASTKHTIADPGDAGMLNVVGFDTAAPNVISQFIAGSED